MSSPLRVRANKRLQERQCDDPYLDTACGPIEAYRLLIENLSGGSEDGA